MIKKAEIIKMYQINLYCDKCGKRMKMEENSSLLSQPLRFKYTCKCGHSEYSTKIYPLQQVLFDEENSIIIEESEIV